jgi:hypothetical protein
MAQVVLEGISQTLDITTGSKSTEMRLTFGEAQISIEIEESTALDIARFVDEENKRRKKDHKPVPHGVEVSDEVEFGHQL